MTRRLLYASVAALVSGALLGCLDAIAPGSPHARGGISLRIAPVFVGAGAQDGIPGDVDLIRIVLHHPPQADTTLNFPIAPGQDSIRIEVPITLNGTGATDTVGVTFQAIRSSDNTVLYSGTQNYEVSVGPPTSPSPLVATYVGPGQNIRSIAISPPSATIKPSDSLTFSSRSLDSSGATIVGMPVLYDSRNTGVVTVSAAGVAKGVALGSTYVVLTSGARAAVKDSALVIVANVAPPAIALSAGSATFTDTALTSDPASQVINVTNGGGGVLSGLSVGNVVYGAGATGWLVATLAANTAPTTLSLAAAKGSLAAGTYTATVSVQAASAGNSPQNVTVTFTIAPAPTIVLSSSAVTFTDTALTTDPPPDTVSVTSAGGTLGGLSVGTVTYGAGGTGWLTATLVGATAPTKLILTAAKGSLAPGTYTATVPAQSPSAGNSPQDVTVTFQIVSASTIVLSSATVTFTDTLLRTDPASQTVNVTSAGGLISGLSLGTITSGAGGTGWLTASLGGATATPATVTLAVAKGSLAAGTYTATVPVQSGLAGNSPQNVTVTFTIAPAPTIGVSSGAVTFNDTLLTGDPADQTVNVTSAGGTLTALSLGTISYGVGGTGWLTVSLNASTTPATLTLGVAKGSLAAGTYTATVPVQAALAGNTPQSVTVTFNVAPPPLATLAVAPGYQVMSQGGTLTLVATGKDGSGNPATPFGLSYTSRSPGVASVNAATGLITAVAAGTAVIVAQAPTATGTTADSTLIVVPASGSAVVAAIGDGRAFDVAKVGNTLKVRVLVDLRAVPGDTLGSYNAQLNWSTAALTYVSSAAVSGGFAAPTLNETQTASGQLRFGSADASGSGGAFALIEVTFTAAVTGSSPLTLTLTDLSMAKTFTQLLSAAVIVSGSATVH